MIDLHESGQVGAFSQNKLENLRYVVREWVGADPSPAHALFNRDVDQLIGRILEIAGRE